MLRHLFIAALSAVLSLGACAADDAPRALRIGVSTYAPFVSYDNAGEPAGIDVDLAKAACRKLGCQPSFVSIRWDDKEEALKAHRIDCVWTAFPINGNEDKFLLTEPYLVRRLAVMVPDGSPVQKLADLDHKIVAVTHGSKAEQLLLDPSTPGFAGEIYSLGRLPGVFECLNRGYVDAAAADESALNVFRKISDKHWRFLAEPLGDVRAGVAFARNADSRFVKRLSQTLSELRRDGTLAAILKKYGYTEPEPSNNVRRY